jgi:hypothetical protein
VGIGASSPVTFGANTHGLTLNGTASGQHITFQQGGQNKGFIYNSTNDMIFASEQTGGSLTLGSILKVGIGGSERIRIDSSGTLLVGKTSDTFATVGTSIFDHGEVQVTRAGSVPMYLRRNTNDGTILEFRKDATAVGGIGVTSGSIAFGQSNTALGAFNTDRLLFPATSAGVVQDNAINLGYSGGRFKDLYLSGGVYLGGTGAGNKLEDYEEGTWTPAFISVNSTTPTGSFSHAGTYTKIGQLVTLIGYMQINTSGTLNVGGGNLAITGQPFTAIVGDGKQSVGAITAHQWNPERNDRMGVTTYDGTRLGFLTANDNSGWVWEQTGSLKSGTVMRFGISYHTTS